MRWAKHKAHMGAIGSIYNSILVRKPEGERERARSLGRYEHKWKDNIKINL